VLLGSKKKNEGFIQGEGCLVWSFSSFHLLEKVVNMYSLQVAGKFFLTARSKHVDW